MRRILLVLAMTAMAAMMLAASAVFALADPAAGKDLCKNGGFANYTSEVGGAPFANQGQCVAFVNHNGSDALIPVGEVT